MVMLCSGSSYTGEWNVFGMNGPGKYTTPDGVQYEGGILDGHFHGEGKLTFPNGGTMTGYWTNGICSDRQYRFADGLAFVEHDWDYCREGGTRRFCPEDHPLVPVGRHVCIPHRMDTHPIPVDCYHTGEGFYNPKTKCLYSLQDPKLVVGIPTEKEEAWILANCPSYDSCRVRVGYREDLLEPTEGYDL